MPAPTTKGASEMDALAKLEADVKNELSQLVAESGDVKRIITNLAILDLIEKIDPAELDDLPFTDDWNGEETE